MVRSDIAFMHGIDGVRDWPLGDGECTSATVQFATLGTGLALTNASLADRRGT